MIMRKLTVLCVATSLALLTACSAGQPSSPAASSDALASSPIDQAIDHAMDKASTALATRNITVSDHDDNAPKAEITPQGDFLIAGKPVPLTPAQRNEVLAYRQQLIGVAQQGIAIGKQGATLGLHAASEAIAAAFSGKSDQQIRQRVEAQTSGIRKAAVKICKRLPALMKQQQELAAALPAFRPYATMTQEDIDDCRSNALKGDVDD